MRNANEESSDSPFKPYGIPRGYSSQRIIKQKLCGGISKDSPSYFHINHINILDEKNRTQELFKGYKMKEKTDFKLISHPELIPQEKRLFDYEDFKMNKGSKIFDYSSMKPSNLIDLMADKRPNFKKTSNFYVKYNEELDKNGFRRNRGIFTIESNQRHKFGQTSSSRFGGFDEYIKQVGIARNNLMKASVDQEIIKKLAKLKLPVSIRTGKKSMNKVLKRKVSYS